MNGDEKIRARQFFDDERKILIIGDKSLQIWDTDSGKLLVSAAHQISAFAPRGFVSDVLLLGLPRLFEWRPFTFDIGGKWLITVEKVGAKDKRSAIVRDLRTLKQIAVLNLPTAPIDDVAFDESRNEIMARGDIGKTNEFAGWSGGSFQLKSAISIDEHKWHQLIDDERKMIVGSGSTKIPGKDLNLKQDDNLTLRDVKTGAVEKEYTANNLNPKSEFRETTVSEDEKYLIAKRDDRIFVWEIQGDGAPKYEISNPNPKGTFSLKKIADKKFIVVRIDDQLRVYNIEGGGAPKIVVASANPKDDVSYKDLFGDRYLVAKVEEQFRIYDIKGDGTSFFELAPSAANENISLVDVPDNRLIVIRVDKKLRVYDAQTKTLKLDFASETVDDSIDFIDSTGDGRYVVVSDDRNVLVFDLENAAAPLYKITRSSEKERFSIVRFLDERNWLFVARVNNSEKKEPRTEIYEIPTGKMLFELPDIVGYDAVFSPDGKLLSQTHLGSFDVWNVPERKFYSLKLKVYSPPSQNYNEPNYYYQGSESPYNTEFTKFSPDYRYVLRYDGNVTSVFDAANGELRQSIFDAERVKYDKKTNEIKSSGLDEAGWIRNGAYIYAMDSGGLLSNGKTISFWEVKK